MRRILVSPVRLDELSGQLGAVAEQLRAAGARLGATLGALDWEVREQENVEASVLTARSQAAALAAQAEGMAGFLRTRAELFRTADDRGVQELQRSVERLAEQFGRTMAAGPLAGITWAQVGPWLGAMAGAGAGAGAGAAVPVYAGGSWMRTQFPEAFGITEPAYDGSAPAPGTERQQAAHPVTAPLQNAPGARSRLTYDGVINQFAVGSNPRYAIRDSSGDGVPDTFCNIFVWDVTSAMGAEIPHWTDDHGVPMPAGQKGAWELNANAVAHWLDRHGPDYGWREVPAEEAQQWANDGHPAVAAWDSGSGAPGHVAMVRPGQFDQERGAAIAQAGGQNLNQTTVAEGFGQRRMRAIRYYVHE